jgi:hypothetical protein
MRNRLELPVSQLADRWHPAGLPGKQPNLTAKSKPPKNESQESGEEITRYLAPFISSDMHGFSIFVMELQMEYLA